MPVVVGPKQATPPLTPTRNTPPLVRRSPPPIPPHIPLRMPLNPPPRPPAPHHWEQKKTLVSMVTGESQTSLEKVLSQWLFTVMYLSLSGQSDNAKVSIIVWGPFILFLLLIYIVIQGVVNRPENTYMCSGLHNTKEFY